jgi:putative PIN family toxin of toxin-antitoxin system
VRGQVEIVSSWDLADELLAVLARSKLRRYRIAPGDERTILMLLARSFPAVEMKTPVRDPDDAPVIAAALAGQAKAIVSGDSDLLEDDDLRAWLRTKNVEVITPAELLSRLA